ncbi:MAG: DUF805 domain-containing protein [Rhodobiaceae bacterium]|nr:DUF805 domain-containing protein [Rhodobiaceae bacterium]
MSFQEAISSGLSRYIDFNTRSSRSEYWYWVLFVVLLSIVAGVIDSIIFDSPILRSLVTLGLLVPGIAVGVRRLHDIARSGWWYLIVFIPLIGALVLIYWFVQPGTAGSNEYGDNPLGDAAST